jgi:hypothetical protein
LKYNKKEISKVPTTFCVCAEVFFPIFVASAQLIFQKFLSETFSAAIMNENKLKKAASAPETFKKPPIT